jgi:hypothetical protein
VKLEAAVAFSEHTSWAIDSVLLELHAISIRTGTLGVEDRQREGLEKRIVAAHVSQDLHWFRYGDPKTTCSSNRHKSRQEFCARRLGPVINVGRAS